MATKISDTEITSDRTRHTAAAWPVPGELTFWTVTWLLGRALTQSQALTAMMIADTIGGHDMLADPLHAGHRLWARLDAWAAELGITGPCAVAEASLSPQDHGDMPRVRVLFPEPGPVGHLLASDPATGKATARINGETAIIDACRLQYCAPGFPPAAGQEPQTAGADGDGEQAVRADVRGGLLDLTLAERLGLIDAMTDHERSVALAYIAGRAPGVFADAITSRSASFADELFGRIEERDEAEYMADPEGYCTGCGENVAHFIGYEGPQHFRGPHKLVTGLERRELFTPDDGHAPQVAWRQSGGAS
jgi:hypothetical protein